MTYGENAGTIRDELGALLRHHRIQQRLGGLGNYRLPETTTAAEREQMGRVIRRYRYACLTWCRRAVEVVSPQADLPPAKSAGLSPIEQLRRQLGRSLRTPEDDGQSLIDLLTTDHDVDLLTRWQRVARAAALGEHDFAADVNLGWLSPEQARILVRDAADVIRGMVVLDRRYQRIPGWQPLPESTRLHRAAEAVADRRAAAPQDLGVDARGWRPAPATITGPALPGVSGAVQAQHNMLVALADFPSALNLRRLLCAQARASHEAARLAAPTAPELVDRFLQREQVYRTLVAHSRNLGGLIGAGGPAMAESQNAVARLQRTPSNDADVKEPLGHLRRLFTSTDARLAATIERGLHDRLYFVAARSPRRPTDQPINTAVSRRTGWMPMSVDTPTDLLPLVRGQLRTPPPPPRTTPAAAHDSRQAYQALLSQQPSVRRARDTRPAS
jgi:hypothetical protein